MTILSNQEQDLLKNLSELAYCNPFLPRRVELERLILGKSNHAMPTVWSFHVEDKNIFEPASLISKQIQPLAEKLRTSFVNGEEFSPQELGLYEDLILYFLYDKYRGKLNELLVEYSRDGNHTECKAVWDQFSADFVHYTGGNKQAEQFTLLRDPEHMWASFFQIRRLFHYVFYWIVGSSNATVGLRASIWQSVVTHNLRRYFRSLYQCMGNISTLITGPSGTGKELVARAIGMSRYVPFDGKKAEFVTDYSQSLLAMHLAAMSPTLIESELFGHRKGAFTGATEDRKGLFETCHQDGTVFLDEIGELVPEIQVKLLRVLQNRTFQRLGDLATCNFTGKIVTATNRDFDSEMQCGNFRADLYYRLCSDMIRTPSLSDQLADQPDDLRHLVNHLSRQLSCEDHEELTNEVVDWIDKNLGPSYAWPGNVRELEQCLRNIMIRGQYRPAHQIDSGTRQEIGNQFMSCSLTADELLANYCTMVYAQTGSYEESSRRLKIDRRTVKSRVDPELLEKLTAVSEAS